METLFHGQKVWIGRQTPQRRSYVDVVEQNGGEVVADERDATLLITGFTGPARAAPPGCLSVAYLTDSLNSGSLLDHSDYLLDSVAPPSAARPMRTPFTVEDDRLLIEWTKKAAREGNRLNGNELYKEFAAQVSFCFDSIFLYIFRIYIFYKL